MKYITPLVFGKKKIKKKILLKFVFFDFLLNKLVEFPLNYFPLSKILKSAN
jgi:hypothetical protein